MNILMSSTELVDILMKVDTAYHSKSSRTSSVTFNSYKFIPSIREQLTVSLYFYVTQFLGKTSRLKKLFLHPYVKSSFENSF